MDDWTVDPETGRSNSSEFFSECVEVVESLIRGDAVMLLRGRADNTARLIVAQLAHTYHLAPQVAAMREEHRSMSEAARMLAEFHRAFAHPDTDALWLRPTLHDEEHAELIEALASGDRAAIARELADVLYIAYGTAHVYGIDLDAALAEVHRANMSKLAPCVFCATTGNVSHCEDCGYSRPYDHDPICGLCGHNGAIIERCQACGGEGRVALRRDDGKVLKGPKFRAPDMTRAVSVTSTVEQRP